MSQDRPAVLLTEVSYPAKPVGVLWQNGSDISKVKRRDDMEDLAFGWLVPTERAALSDARMNALNRYSTSYKMRVGITGISKEAVFPAFFCSI